MEISWKQMDRAKELGGHRLIKVDVDTYGNNTGTDQKVNWKRKEAYMVEHPNGHIGKTRITVPQNLQKHL